MADAEGADLVVIVADKASYDSRSVECLPGETVIESLMVEEQDVALIVIVAGRIDFLKVISAQSLAGERLNARLSLFRTD